MIEIAPGIAVAGGKGMTVDGLPVEEWNRVNAIWQENCHKRIDSSIFDLDAVLSLLRLRRPVSPNPVSPASADRSIALSLQRLFIARL